MSIALAFGGHVSGESLWSDAHRLFNFPFDESCKKFLS